MKSIPEWNPATLLQSLLFAPLHPVLACLPGQGFPTLQDCNALLLAHQPPIAVQCGLPLRFVPQKSGKLAFEMQYEPRCYLTGEVQMRERIWHDLLNALVWLTFPQAKAAINARHYQVLKDANLQSQRGAVRDMATLFDESGVIIVCAEAELANLLREFQWKELFWQRREQVGASMDFYIFGHGLYEKALQPYIGMTGQGLLLIVEQEFFTWPLLRRLAYLDDQVAAYLNAPEHCRSTRELAPLPLLGIPGWTAGNAEEGYYNNVHYFRAGRRLPV
ncbi:MAG: DUF3025 domain-containing protein, partial [Gallionellaceae bacterium]|nr:DUF3025 domain-containing protein [Gallionellaceae bacterium]